MSQDVAVSSLMRNSPHTLSSPSKLHNRKSYNGDNISRSSNSSTSGAGSSIQQRNPPESFEK